MRKLIVASNNKNKIIEIKEILKDCNIDVVSLEEENIFIEVEEDGKTFKENSYKKAKEIKDYLVNKGKRDFIVMADDSGITIDGLKGAPGVYSARYAGESCDPEKNNDKVLLELKNVPWDQRTAQFVCHITLLDSGGKEFHAEGVVSGRVTEERTGTGGFGYDPIFYIDEYKKTFGQLSSDEKNKISHRAKALAKAKEIIKDLV